MQQIIMLCPVTVNILFKECNLRSGPAALKAIFFLLIPADLAMLEALTGCLISFKNTEAKILRLKWFGTNGLGSTFIALVKSRWLKGGLCLGTIMCG